ncbi:unnamed protein product [Prorocentrum cordatum]|uniref:RanBP2-type domain-containing protein n=1 Tax=Prorocentrum cordatum TaxID=2364126 RepID=A0ABN9PUW0_9DINO|nr:unnamed protein product [Polarella glacialis]
MQAVLFSNEAERLPQRTGLPFLSYPFCNKQKNRKTGRNRTFRCTECGMYNLGRNQECSQCKAKKSCRAVLFQQCFLERRLNDGARGCLKSVGLVQVSATLVGPEVILHRVF